MYVLSYSNLYYLTVTYILSLLTLINRDYRVRQYKLE